ncbi:lytic murein transglycosylase [Micromonospora sp. NPDC049679]|uniref:lytic transglycosylase domain-containing protein n=1 Tax=Micromonospora sp. NPDC049679 TaxID=3155920 RepID=UPI0033E3F330
MVNGDETAAAGRLRSATPPPESPPTAPVVPAPRPAPSSKTAPAASTAPTTDDPTATTADPRDATSTASGDTPSTTSGDTPSTANGDSTAGAATAAIAAGADAGATVPVSSRRGRFRVPFAHAIRRLPPPRQAATRTRRAVADWSRRPSGRLILPGLLLLTLVATAGVAGAIVVPATARDAGPASGQPEPASSVPDAAQPAPGEPGLPVGASGAPTGTPSGMPGVGPGVAPVTGGRPADVLTAWAQQLSARLDVSPVALAAYGYAELVLKQTTPGCRLTWTTLAAIGKVESQHGRANTATLQPDGQASPKIVGPALNGQGGTLQITDTDRGEIDGDLIYDRAIGPMQFIPTTWREIGADADNNGVKDPNNIHDAALAAGNYLCKQGRDLTVAQDWWKAILSYNDVRPYAQDVFDTANEYGRRSRT